MSERQVTAIFCGKPRDHKCDDNGPILYGGDDVETTTEPPDGKKGYSWGSVSCSICGRTSIENSTWEGD